MSRASRNRNKNNFDLGDPYESLLAQAESEIRSTDADLDDARELMQKAGLSTEGELSQAITTAAATGGHSNTDHRVRLTGDYVHDRITELRRRYLLRQRTEQPESRGEERWDKPRASGERRRRIARKTDLPTAPPEPPLSGYICFLGQMTTKIRHDRPDEPHDQSRVMLEISRLWRMALSDGEREYYNDFSDECRQEYRRMEREFRATGHYTASDRFERLNGTGSWVHKVESDKNYLEREIATYETVIFPARPPELDEEYKRRENASYERRKAKLKAEREAKGNPKRKRRRRKAQHSGEHKQEEKASSQDGENSHLDG